MITVERNKKAVMFGELKNSSNTHTHTHTHTQPRAKFRQFFLTIKELRQPDNSTNQTKHHTKFVHKTDL